MYVYKYLVRFSRFIEFSGCSEWYAKILLWKRLRQPGWGGSIWTLMVAVFIIFIAPTPGAAVGGWLNEERLTCDDALSYFPPNNGKCITVDLSGRVHVVWADERDRNAEIYHMVKKEGVWSSPERVTFDSERSARPVLAVDCYGLVHLVWNDSRDGNKEIYHKVWLGSWSSGERVSQTDGDSFGPSVVADSNNIHLVYHEEISGHLEIMYRRYDAYNWSGAVPLTNIQSGDREVPSIDIADDRSLHVVWWDIRGDTTGKIYYRKKEQQWLDEELVSGPDADAMRPSVAVDDSGYVHVAWIDKRSQYEQIYYARRGEGGWGEEVPVTSQNVTHYHPSLASSGEKIDMVYWANLPSMEKAGVFYRSLTAGGWSGPIRISGSQSCATLCCIVAEPNRNLHTAWVDSRYGYMQTIYYRGYIDPANGIEDPGQEEPPEKSERDLYIRCRPNPFSTGTAISVFGPRGCGVRVAIYDIGGRRVRVMEKAICTGGRCVFSWDGLDREGMRVAPGIYLVRARVGKIRVSSKLVHIR